MRAIEQILNLVCDFLNKNDIDYVIVGGFAVLFYGNPRTTMDIDYVIQLEDENIPVLIEFLQENGFHADEYDMRTAFREKSHCTVEDKETMFRLDINMLSHFGFSIWAQLPHWRITGCHSAKAVIRFTQV